MISAKKKLLIEEVIKLNERYCILTDKFGSSKRFKSKVQEAILGRYTLSELREAKVSLSKLINNVIILRYNQIPESFKLENDG